MSTLILSFFARKEAVMIRCPCNSHPISALCADLEIIRATPCACAASSYSCPENNSDSLEVFRFCPEPVHCDSLIPRMARLNYLITAAIHAVFPVSYMVGTFHVPMVAVVLVVMMVFGLMASS
ncbi:hypothetical protein DPMN_179075 [Dreissena polymorpha]|uniref:Transmembrane protein n=1 Tax=Dreissena polymorpha TaxID=45954 RepID=A0A9D4EC45_DREPO|nr:hypothetical protein DPMN_179075 [Dreissena polymorpha]